MSKHTAIYIRVSSRTQDTKSQEPDLKIYEKAAASPVKWYRDSASGKTMDRPGWKKLEEAIRSGKVSTVVVWRIDRLGRTAKGLTDLFDFLGNRKVNLVSLKDNLDLATPAGRLMAHVLASVAQYETEIRAERITAGQAAAKASGKKWGGSKPGVRKKVSEAQIKAVLELKQVGTGITDIARALNLSRPTIYEILRSNSVRFKAS